MRIRGYVVKSWIKASAALLLIFLASGISSAYANTLVATSPIAGSTLKAGPSAVSITTELPLMEFGNEVSVTDPNGKRVDSTTFPTFARTRDFCGRRADAPRGGP